MRARNNRKLFSVWMIVMLLMAGLAVQPALANGPVAPAAGSGTTLYLPLVMVNNETFEPNDTLGQAYGPIASGTTISSILSTDSDYDYYFFTISSLGNINVTLTRNGQPSPLELSLYDAGGRVLGTTNVSTLNKQIVFTPVTPGNYYVRVCLCNLSLHAPQTYDLKVTYNGAPAPGDVFGHVMANGAASSNTPIRLDRFDFNNPAGKNSYYTVTAPDGTYHFRGVASVGGTVVLQVVYNSTLGPGFINLAQSTGFPTYAAGQTLNTGTVDISPITLMAPADSVSASLPVTFNWSVRPTTPAETYRVVIFDPNNLATSFTSTSVGHAGTFTLSSLPAGFVTNHAYAWMVNATGPNGEYDFSFTRTITFLP